MWNNAMCTYVCVQLETLAVADVDVKGVRYVPLWIIIISIIAGLLLLTIVIILLWKVTYKTS